MSLADGWAALNLDIPQPIPRAGTTRGGNHAFPDIVERRTDPCNPSGH